MSLAIYFVGESHSDAVAQAIKRRAPAPRYVTLNITHVERWAEPGLFRTPVVQATMTSLGGPKSVYFLMLGGNAHNILGLLKHPIPFDFTLPGEPDLPFEHDAQPLTFAYVRATLAGMMAPTFDMLEEVIASVPGSFYHLESPPPAGDDAYVASHLDGHFSARLQGRSLVSPIIRYKLWRAHSEIMSQECNSRGIGYVRAPRDSLVDGKYLRPDLCGNATHGNMLYGEMLLLQAERIVGNEASL